MSGRTLYDRVRAAYGLDDDGLLSDEPSTFGDDVAFSPSALNPEAEEYTLDHDANVPQDAALPGSVDGKAGLASFTQEQLGEALPDGGVNSVRVPFDPEDQSDDEVMVTTAYRRQTNTAANDRAAEQQKPANRETAYDTSLRLFQDAARKEGSTGSNAGKKTLSATAPPFQPRAANGGQHIVAPLVDIFDDPGRPRNDVGCGHVYPGHRVPFCPWSIVSNYHLWFVGKQNSERIAPYFQTSPLLQCQAWDFCYVWHPAREEWGKHILIVPTAQFQHFVDRINQTLGIQITIPPGKQGEKFRVIFGQQKTPLPRFLGHASDEYAFNFLAQNIPPPERRDFTFSTAHAKDMYLKKINGLLQTFDKAEQKKQKADRVRLRRARTRQITGRQIKRIQRYLGLRGKAPHQQDKAATASLHPLDLDMAAPYTHENDVVFVAMDIESYEYNHSALTEIGFGILDTRDIVGVPPGPNGMNWHALVRGRHLRIREHVSMVNRTFVKGCENNFNFGTTEFVHIRNILDVVTSILQPPSLGGEIRNVVLVGHDVKSDISLVENIGFFVKDHPFLEIIDTQDVHQNFRMRNQQMGLRGVLTDVGIEYSFLHNGGNDAVYTLQAMLSLVLKKRQDSLRRQNERMSPNYTPDIEAVQQGWASGGELSDGGYPEKDGDLTDEDAAKESSSSHTTPLNSWMAASRNSDVRSTEPIPIMNFVPTPAGQPEDLIDL